MVRIITDSTCDLTKERREALGVLCVPLMVHIGEQTYHDGVDLTNTEFYKKLREEQTFPTTAQPTPHTFEEVFAQCLENKEEVVCIFISSKMSGTVQSANIAKNALETEDIYIVDSQTVCLSMGLLVEIAAKMAQDGKSAKEIYDAMETLKHRVRLCAAVETLEYLKKGGRLSATAATIGTLLNVHPIIGIADGLVTTLGKVRGKKKLYDTLKTMAVEDGIDDTYPILFGHAQAQENYDKLYETCADLRENKTVLYGEFGCVVGTHTGPGVVGLAYIKA